MAKIMFPDARFRSPTAVQNRSDVRDEMVYSAVRVADGATGVSKAFTVPQGQAIPSLGTDPSFTSTNNYMKTYTALTTNLTKAGEFGSALGDASVRGIGITVEAAALPSAGSAGSWTTGAAPMEVIAVIQQSAFALRIAGKKQIEQPTWAFPGFGGLAGDTAYSNNKATAAYSGFVTNGTPGSGRRLKIPIMIARTDTVEGEFNVVGSLDLTGSNTNAYLVWFALLSLIKGDVR